MDIKAPFHKKPWVIAGPCSAESQEQLLVTAKAIQSDTDLFRAGVWKPRTRPNSFEGIGEKALEWLQEVKQETDLLVATEVANAQHVEKCLQAGIDVLWLGARTTVNPFYVQEIAEALKGVDMPIMVKNPLHPELSLWIGALERLNKVGINQLTAIHRGFFTLEKSAFRNEPKWEIPIRLKKKCPELPIICDPSHISGNRTMIQEVAQTALDLNMSGLMVETHVSPQTALSDAEQQITPKQLSNLISSLVLRETSAEDKNFNAQLKKLRESIDEVDMKLLQVMGDRTKLVQEIGRFKKENSVTILQIERWFEILKTRQEMGVSCNLENQMVSELFELIHKHSILTQTDIMKK
ncbi:MAG: 3-deoxy-7-phosphoheptulonate synthase [Flavobacteriales bacterium]|nr:3-deoxy-7-phosphoheptulonate synthase [Flavobacteriales bacterium]|tara:strand:+ start:6607 stop:7662 length:1056 start_codon:yes stop_codon:yes gene_type:complete